MFLLLERNSQTIPDVESIFFAPTGTQETWLSTYQNVLRMASFLTSKGVKAGDIVVVDFMNKPTVIHIWFALSAIGASPAFINYTLTGTALLNCLQISGAKLFLVDEAVSDKVLPVSQNIVELGIDIDILDEASLKEISSLSLKRPTHQPTGQKGSDAGCIFYTRSVRTFRVITS